MPSEFTLIARFLAPFAPRGAGVVLGPGDDCAVLRPSPGQELCVTVDATVEGVHFSREAFSDPDIGHKALAVNLSDLASMGARPRWFVCSVACRPDDARRLDGIARGMARLAARAGIALVGGNFTRAEALSLHITAAGETPPGEALRRSAARPGDRVYVTGTLGDSALGLELLKAGRASPRALSRQRRPEPRLRAGLLARRFARAAIDVSDGLVQDVGHLARASEVAVHLDAARLPLSRRFRRERADLRLALTGGEDYELVLCVPKERCAALERAFARAGEPLTRIGEVGGGRGVAVSHGPALRAVGFDHFLGARS